MKLNGPAATRFREWRSEGCCVCGITDWRVIQAHHIDPSTKEEEVAWISNLITLEKELLKCVPLCANHHILVHDLIRNEFSESSLEDVVYHLKQNT